MPKNSVAIGYSARTERRICARHREARPVEGLPRQESTRCAVAGRSCCRDSTICSGAVATGAAAVCVAATGMNESLVEDTVVSRERVATKGLKLEPYETAQVSPTLAIFRQFVRCQKQRNAPSIQSVATTSLAFCYSAGRWFESNWRSQILLQSITCIGRPLVFLLVAL